MSTYNNSSLSLSDVYTFCVYSQRANVLSLFSDRKWQSRFTIRTYSAERAFVRRPDVHRWRIGAYPYALFPNLFMGENQQTTRFGIWHQYLVIFWALPTREWAFFKADANQLIRGNVESLLGPDVCRCWSNNVEPTEGGKTSFFKWQS